MSSQVLYISQNHFTAIDLLNSYYGIVQGWGTYLLSRAA